jgi:hypothetical protein
MCRAADVVSRKFLKEFHHALGISDLDTAKERFIVCSTIFTLRITVEKFSGIRANTSEVGVRSGGVAGPHCKCRIWQWVAGLDVYGPNVEIEIDNTLVLTKVMSLNLTIDAISMLG